MKWILSPQARTDLLEVWNFIAEDSVEAADRITEKLTGSFDQLGRNPHIGHSRRDLTSRDLLFWPVGAYIVIYRVRNEVLEVVAVTQGSRDLPTLLKDR
jgi:plasmid stabilization system protein ParE